MTRRSILLALGVAPLIAGAEQTTQKAPPFVARRQTIHFKGKHLILPPHSSVTDCILIGPGGFVVSRKTPVVVSNNIMKSGFTLRLDS